jgi:uncharacterized coiled-coil protein SlyX
MDEQLLTALQKLLETGVLDKPGSQTFLVYALLSALIIALIRIFLINGWLKKGINRFFDLEEMKLESLKTLNEKVVNLQTQVAQLHEKLYDLLQMFHAQRQSDKP